VARPRRAPLALICCRATLKTSLGVKSTCTHLSQKDLVSELPEPTLFRRFIYSLQMPRSLSRRLVRCERLRSIPANGSTRLRGLTALVAGPHQFARYAVDVHLIKHARARADASRQRVVIEHFPPVARVATAGCAGVFPNSAGIV
jgi:hypothetical protein